MPIGFGTGLNEKSFATSPGVLAAGNVQQIATIARQKKSNWCWAAVATSIVASKSPLPAPTFVDQCELAFATYQFANKPPSREQCCSGGPAVCNGPLAPDWLAGDAATSPLSIAGIAKNPPHRTDKTISDHDILAALNAGRPVCIVIVWPSGVDFHFVAIVGARKEGVQRYLVGDPIDGSHHWLTREEIDAYDDPTSTNIGRWGDTYVTI